MESISYTRVRANLARTMKKVVDDRQPIVITRANEPAVVMMSLDEFESLEETAHLLRSPKNARRLLDAIHQLESGKGKRRSLAG